MIMSKFLAFISAFVLIFSACKQKESAAPVVPVPFTQVHLTDNFWAPRIEINRTVSIPSAFHQCEINGRFDNFALAGGLIKGEHKGDFPFDDTDPYKIIEGASYSLAVHFDPKLDAYLDSVIALIAAAQEPDGYLTTCVTNKCERLSGWWGKERWEKINSHELYNSGHLYEAATAHYQATGKRALLNVAIRNADLVCKVFGPGENQKHVSSGHPIIEMALAKLYEVTGNENYLTMARYFVEETGRGTDGRRLSPYSQDHKPVLQQEEIVGHAVRAGYLYSGVVDVATLTHDTDYLHAVTRIWNNMANKKLYITGGIGSRSQGEGFGPEYELHNHTNYCETCASIANVYWNQRMFLATGEAKYADVLERALYNGVLSGVSLSGDRFFYDNLLASNGKEERQPWFGCACCPGNITRFMASVPKYMYAVRENNLFVNLYAASRADITLAGVPVELTQTTDYPWDGTITFTVNPQAKNSFILKLRIPGWATDRPIPGSDLYTFTSPLIRTPYSLSVNGKTAHFKEKNGYITIDREWQAGDKVEVSFPMPPRYIKARPEVKADRGRLAIQRGPIVYCLEGIDQPDRHVFNKYISGNETLEYAFEPTKLNGIVELSGAAQEVANSPSGITEREVSFKAIPYSVWNNRGKSEMTVWAAATAEAARPVPAPTIASRAQTFIIESVPSGNSFIERASGAQGANDQWEPTGSDDTSTPYLYFWLKRGGRETVEYRFEQPETVQNMQVYWLEFDHYDGDYRLPASWKLQYKDGNTWKDVETKDAYGCRKDAYNSVTFAPVRTTALRLIILLQEGYSGGIIESKIS
ncbi:MAG: Beta-L-arabinofuranosidase/glycoside hydrolase family 127 protein [Bacteroidales bacterium]